MRLQVYTRTQMESILMDKVIDKSARQIALFLVILSIVSAAIVAFHLYLDPYHYTQITLPESAVQN